MQWPLFRQELADDARKSLNSEFVAKFVDIPYYLALWTEHLGYLSGKRVLDFGCGYGETAAGVAAFHNAAEVCGVDINTESENLPGILQECIGYVPPLPNLLFKEIAPDEFLGDAAFDFIYTWSAMEHVHPSLMANVVEHLFKALAPGGRLLVQVAPLYHSAEGAHLSTFGIRAWEHLFWPDADLQAHVFGFPGLSDESKKHAWNCYRTLNRITSNQLIQIFLDGGFLLEKKYSTTVDTPPPSILADTYLVEALTTNQVVIFLERP